MGLVQHRGSASRVMALGVFAFGAALVLSVSPALAGPDDAAQYCTGLGIETSAPAGGSVHLARAWRAVVDERFEQGLAGLEVSNYDQRLKIGVEDGDGSVAGQKVAVITREGPRVDAGFELRSKPVPVTAGRRYRFAILARHNVDLTTAFGFQDFYWSQIQWLSSDGKPVGFSRLNLGPEAPTWREYSVEDVAPAGAARAVVRVGFNRPFLAPGQYFRVARMTFGDPTDPPRYVAEGELLLRPRAIARLSAPPSLGWQGKTPPATHLRFQVRSALDVDGGPRDWTDFVGPDGTPQSFFTVSATPLPAVHRGHGWFQCRVRLATASAAVTPELIAIRWSGDGREEVERSWSAPDTAPPVLARHEPTRPADGRGPLVFALADDPGGVGVDRHTLAVTLDGASISSQIRRLADGTFRYDLPQPLAPDLDLPPLGMWPGGAQNAEIQGNAPRLDNGEPVVNVWRASAKRDTTGFVLTAPRVSVQGGATYRFSCWARHAIDLTSTVSTAHMRTGVQWLDADGQPVGFSDLGGLFGPANTTWHEDQATVTAPAGAKWAVASIGWAKPTLPNSEAKLWLADARLEGPHPDASSRPNLHHLVIRAKDFAGNAMTRDWWILVAPRPTEGVITLRDDGVALRDGRPWFPVGLYSVWKREHNHHDFEQCFAELQAARFNLIHTYNITRTPELEEYFAVAHRHGIQVFLSPGIGPNNMNPARGLTELPQDSLRPNFAARYLADDAAAHITAPGLLRVHQSLRDVDPFHLTIQCDSVGSDQPGKSRYTDYVDATDVFSPQLYPIHKMKNYDVASVIRDMQAIAADQARAGHKTAVWPAIQAFDYEPLGYDRLPTEAEVRASTYLSLIHGATGMTFYTYGYGIGKAPGHGVTWKPKFWEFIKGLATEMATLGDVLTERDVPQTQQIAIVDGPQRDGLDYPAISTKLKQHQGKWYLLATNSAKSTVRARFTVPERQAAVQVLFEDRSTPARSGSWEDAFAPYAVHVYAW